MNLEELLLGFSTLILISIFIARISNNLGVPVLLLFLGIGMLAGSEGAGGMAFDDTRLAQSIGITSLVFILFSGGLSTHWHIVKPVLFPAISLATLGVVVTAGSVAIFAHYVFDVSLLVSLLLGSIVASTDAAAVFSIIGARNIKIKGNITPLLELESGSNDPMAVFLTITMIEIIQMPDISFGQLALQFLMEMGIGLGMGLLLGKGIVFIINRLKIPIEGLYQVFVFASAFFVYASTNLIHGSGFLAVYVAGMVVGNHNIVHKKNVFRFFDGMAWVAQIVMFLTLGLLVFPSHILTAFKTELSISLFLIILARPLGVFISLIPFKFSFKEMLFISWVGLRGAVPIILATFPLLAGVAEAQWIFNVVFFIVITSALLQGWTIPFVLDLLHLKDTHKPFITSPTEFNHLDEVDRVRINMIVPDNATFNNQSIVSIKALQGCLIITVKRGDTYFVPSGGTVLQSGDYLQALVSKSKVEELQSILEVSQ
ncbi:potassium/proton antiporter [Cytophaga hutchinsonii]|uniref:Potassium/proton antiporter, CPA1 family n=1 Tax=Cytophaga hutchinsonii (strain ATCC 33406 / DSM 1761 / CIP 103989 / NBRC 15051 / NCIMB 9469 / D465) TaxID=269798 RepID=A0A6N4SRU3_CYTH3|nr:potassium/proton antiporter [Cytophaga hutchinsonii]ABG59108.1 potassium/proton antiporter, CPA1 family [Cytophaga hutchinsonii ATCC 33406]SFX36657.1 potassium/proton antiporter, CPA1 family [Cytophaga hutchinsonii ATCC 33406]